jgi:hypothetical protein
MRSHEAGNYQGWVTLTKFGWACIIGLVARDKIGAFSEALVIFVCVNVKEA